MPRKLKIAVLAAAIAAGGMAIVAGCSSTQEHRGGRDDEHHHDGDATHEGEHADATPSGKLTGGVRVIAVKARQFEFDPATIVVRSGEKVRLDVQSEDVTHGIGIPDLGIDRELPQGEVQQITFTAGEPGTHHFHCTVYCGEGHDGMHGQLVVMPPEDSE